MDDEFLGAGKFDLKYLQDLAEDATDYFAQLILNIYNGVSANLGIPNPDMLASKSPKELRKGFLSDMANLGRRIKGYIGRKLRKTPYEPFKVKGMKLYKKDKPLTNQQWRNFERQVEDYLQPYIDSIGEDISVKAALLSMASTEAENQGKRMDQYGKKSFEQIEQEYFGGVMPDTMLSAEERYDMDRDFRNGINLAYTRVAEYMTNTSDKVRKAVKEQVINAYRTGKSTRELASDLFWMQEDKPELKEYTAEINMREWNRVAKTEIAAIHETAKTAQYESQAKKSIDIPEKAVYFMFTGTGRCDFCAPHQGDIVRMIPQELVGNGRDDSLSSRGISDPHTDTATWVGKNNIGYKRKEWRVVGNAHPYCGCSLVRINPEKQKYDKRTGTIRYKGGEEFEKFIPGDFLEELESERSQYRERQDLLAKERAKSLQRKKT